MIGLRVAHLLGSLHVSAAASTAINLMRWLQANGHDTVLATSGGAREDDCRAEGFQILRYREGGPGWWLKGRRELGRRLADWGPDLLHVHRLESLPLGIFLARKLDVPLVSSVHRAVSADEAKPLRDPNVALILVPSEAQRAHYVGRLGIDRDRIAVLPYGLDLDRYRSDLGDNEIRSIGAIGNFDDDASGFRTLIDALADLREAGLPVTGILVGSGSDEGRRDLESRIAARGLADAVRIETSGVRTAPFLRQMDVFVYPVSQDTHSLAVIKAMAAACPVVASATGGIPELIGDGRNGLLVPPKDRSALVGALRRLVEDPPFARALGRNGRAQVEEQHNLELVGEVAHELYRTALRGTATGTGGTEALNAYRRHTSAFGRGPGAA